MKCNICKNTPELLEASATICIYHTDASVSNACSWSDRSRDTYANSVNNVRLIILDIALSLERFVLLSRARAGKPAIALSKPADQLNVPGIADELVHVDH